MSAGAACDQRLLVGPIAHDLRIDVASFVEQVQTVVLDDLDQQLGVLGIGRIAGLLEPVGPSFIVQRVELEQVLIAFGTVQKLGVVAIGVFDGGVLAKAFARRVVVVRDRGSGPCALAFDAEMIVRFAGEPAVAVVRFEKRLCHFDAGRDAVDVHLLDGESFVAADILLARQFLLPEQSGDVQHGGDQQRDDSVRIHSFGAFRVNVAEMTGEACGSAGRSARFAGRGPAVRAVTKLIFSCNLRKNL